MDFYKNVPTEQFKMLSEFRKHEYIHIDNWRYKAIGEGKPLVLLSGGFMNADMWFYVAQHIEGYRIMIPDSYVRQGIFDLNDVCDKINNMMDNEGFDSASFIGISAGGGLLQYMLSKSPESIDCAVLSHTGVLDPLRADSIEKTVKFAKYLPEFVLRMILKKKTMQKYPDSEWKEFTKAFVSETAQGFTKKAFLGCMEGSIDVVRNYRFKYWNGPMLILTSKDDKLSYDQACLHKEHYPQAKIHVFENGSHHTVLIHPEKYTRQIIHFLKHD